MPSLALPDRRLIWFAHCPKAGGTSVERLMIEAWDDAVGHLHWGWDLWWKAGGWRVADPPNSPQHLIWADARPHLPRAPDRVFALVREPLARMRSEQRWQRRGRRGTLAGKVLAFLPFPIWLRLMLEIARRNPYAFDNHLRPQTDFVPEGAEVFRLEDGIGRVAAWLSETTGADLSAPPHELRTATRERRSDAGSAARVARAFAADYTRFGYAAPAAALPRPGALDRLCAGLARPLAWAERRGLL